jgi:glutamyl-tRNA synthetase
MERSIHHAKRRGRFAPTPSGQLHVGNAWTALLSWWQMRSCGGEYVLRMEDIDKPRSKPEFARQILEDLRWLGIDWDEGPDVGGPYGPYKQSEREELYKEALKRLWRDGRLYPCYCSRAELMAVASAPHGLGSEGPVYAGTCRHLTDDERAKKSAVKEPSLRFALPEQGVSFADLVAGWQEFPAGSGGDFVVKRADGMFGYQLAVVVDDAAMAITDVLRGADLLDSTPRQLWLYAALDLTPPQFAHVPLLCGPDGRRLSKRDKSLNLAAIRAAGTTAETLVGCLAWLAGLLERPEPVKARDLIPEFDLDKVPRDPVVLSERLLRELTGE